MNKTILLKSLSLTLLINNAYGMEFGTAPIGPSALKLLSPSESLNEGSSKAVDKVALLRSTPLNLVQVVNFDPDTPLTDAKKQFLVASLVSIDDAVTLSEGRVIIDASKTYVFPPTTSDDESTGDPNDDSIEASEEQPGEGALDKLRVLREANLDDITIVGIEGFSAEEQQAIQQKKDKIVESLRSVQDAIEITEDTETGVSVDISKIVSYPLKTSEPKETAKTKTTKLEKPSLASRALPLTAAFGTGVLLTWLAAKHINSHE